MSWFTVSSEGHQSGGGSRLTALRLAKVSISAKSSAFSASFAAIRFSLLRSSK
jgi:hypothetical protein